MKFKNGEFVVHPQHGVGQVVALSEREFTPGTKQPYYEIAIAGGSVWVPVDLSISGLRGLAVKSEITHCRQILEASPFATFRGRALPPGGASGTPQAGDASSPVRGGARPVCLWRAQIHEWHHRVVLPGGARRVLCQEWAFVEGITRTQAVLEIDRLLEKSRETLKKSNLLAGD